MLRDMGVISAPAPPSKSTREKFLDGYRRYILQERGLARSTAQCYLAFAEHFLSYRFGEVDLKFGELGATDVTRFVQDRGPIGKGTCQTADHWDSIFSAISVVGERLALTWLDAYPRSPSGRFPPCRSSYLRGQFNDSSHVASGNHRMESAIMPFYCYSQDWDCGPARLSH